MFRSPNHGLFLVFLLGNVAGDTVPYQDHSGRRMQAGLWGIASVVCLASYPLDVFLSDYPGTIVLRLAWAVAFLLGAWVTLRGSPVQIVSTNHALSVVSVVALFLLIGQTGGASSLHIDWILVFPMLAVLLAPEAPATTMGTTVILLLGTPLMLFVWGVNLEVILAREIALMFSGSIALVSVLWHRQQQLERLAVFAEQSRLLEVSRQSEEMRQLAERALRSERLATMGTLMVGTAHDINNMLGVIITNLDMIGNDDEALRESQEAAAIIQGMIRDLVVASRNAPGVAGSSLLAVLNTASRLSRTRWRKYHQVSVECSPELPLINVEKSPMILCFINLIINASDAMGETPGKVLIRASLKSGRVQVTLDDDGPGIPAHLRQSVFEAFFTTKPEGQGTGLGLALCRDFLDHIGGTIEAGSSPDRCGARILLTLPVLEDEQTSGQSGAAEAMSSVR